MKFLLINPLLENIDPERTSSFPVGLAYIGRVILDAGHEAEVFDIQQGGYSREEVEEKIKRSHDDVFFITGLITTFSYIIWLAATIKKHHPEKKIIMGGALATTATRILLENTAVDIAVIDEGEIVTANLIEFLKGNKNSEDVKGIWYKNAQGKIKENFPEERIKNLDSIAFPAWELFDMDKYLDTPVPMLAGGFGVRKRWIYISTSRGCPFNCNFCSKVFGRKVYLRSAENIIAEIKILVDKYNVEHINFCDDLFMTSRARVLRFCELVKKLDKKITWTASSRVDTLDEALLKEMKKAGCLSLGLGIESGSQKILNKMQKRITPEIAARAIQMIRKAGIFPNCSFMLGMLGENEETIRETVDFIKKTDIFPQGLVFTTALPRSELYREALQKGFIEDEVEYLKKMNGTFIDHYVVNFSDLTEARIIELKQASDRELRLHYMLHHPFWAAKNMLDHLKVYGMGESLERFKRKISKHNGRKNGLRMSMQQASWKDDVEEAVKFSAGILGETSWYMALHRGRFEKTLKIAKDNFSSGDPENKSILEIGSWPGYLTLSLARMGCKVNAIDLEPERLEKIKDPNISFLKADINNIGKLPFRDDIFDAVVMTETIEHFSEKKILQILLEIKRVVKPDGFVLITTPNRSRLGNILRPWKSRKNIAKGPGWGHEKEYTLRELAEYLDQSGFKPEILETDNFYSNAGKISKDSYFYPLFSFLSHKNKAYNFGKIISLPVTYVFPFLKDSIIVLAKKQI